MSRALALIAVVTAALALLGGCSLLVSFNPEGQPCETGVPANQQCLADAGYVCVNGFCTQDAGGALDAGR